MPKCLTCAEREVGSAGETCANCKVLELASQPDEGNGEKLQGAAASPGPKGKGARPKKSGEASAKRKTATSKGRASSKETTPSGSDVASGSLTLYPSIDQEAKKKPSAKKSQASSKKKGSSSKKAEPKTVKVTRKLKGGGVRVTKEPLAAPKKRPKPHVHNALARKLWKDPAARRRARKGLRGHVTKLNPNGRKFIGPGGSPRGIRQDGKPRTKPGKNKAKNDETKAFGKEIAKARAKLGLKQWEVAKRANLSQPGYANIERGVAGTTEETRKAILKALKLGNGK
jgi:ribosome-binding protein aMBF1 (putative translation factor)